MSQGGDGDYMDGQIMQTRFKLKLSLAAIFTQCVCWCTAVSSLQLGQLVSSVHMNRLSQAEQQLIS